LIAETEVAAILLAAGLSQRFGSAKLSAPFGGRPLALHAARMLAQFRFGQLICVSSTATGPVAEAIAALGYRMVEQQRPELGLGVSVAAGVRSALPARPRAILIALADMPLVSGGHIAKLIEAFSDERDILASSSDRTAMPPALFGKQHFEHLLDLTGDHGARDLLVGASRVEAAPGELVDIDLPMDMAGASP
jgi:molybdenum cofactor cytidylyltransferase